MKQMKVGDEIPVNKYRFSKELPLNSLSQYEHHRRLGVFYLKGTKCVTCGVLGTRLIEGIARDGAVHLDVYTDDMIMMTVDHIIPRSLNGSDKMANKQPMCTFCNSRKGNGKPSSGVGSKKSVRNAKKFRKKVNKVVNKGFTFVPVGPNINALKVILFKS